MSSSMNRRAEYEAILFDLDGTLTDPRIGITKSVQYGLSNIGIIENDLEALVSFIGAPLFECLRERYSLSEPRLQQVVASYRKYYSDFGIYENHVYPGIPDLLKDLNKLGRKLLVATVKPTVFAERVAEHFRLRDNFLAIVGSDLDSAGFSKTEIIRRALLRLPNVPREKVIMVGDRRHDIIGAHDNSIGCIAVAYGYGKIEELQGANPTHLAHSIEDLRRLLGLQPHTVTQSS